jgi:hypothetical protein
LVGRALIENPTAGKVITGWNNSRILKGATDVTRDALAEGAPAVINAEKQPDNPVERASGGKVGHEALVEKLMKRWKTAKAETDKTTKPLLNMPDSAVAKALEIAGNAI